MLRLFLCRHGNTFAPGDTMIWLGKGQDMPLVPSGHEQAHRAGRWFAKRGVRPACILHSTLSRTKQYAAIIKDAVGARVEVAIEPALDELDYGRWAGLTHDAVAAMGDGDIQDAWLQKSAWPPSNVWPQREHEVTRAVDAFMQRLSQSYRHDDVIIVSSNGILRYCLRQVPHAFARMQQSHQLRVATGSIGELVYDDQHWRLHQWNLPP